MAGKQSIYMSGNLIQSISKRHIILDCLRGLALLGICLANFPEFSLYTFLPDNMTAAMSTAGVDTVIRYLQYIFIDGKFYTIFSLLFGIGFSIILSNAEKNNRNGIRIFYRRILVLFLIGLLHLVCLWAGDILALYAFAGLFLPLFIKVSDRILITCIIVLLVIPVVLDVGVEFLGWNPAAFAIATTKYFHGQFGITENNFPVWLAESRTYLEVLKFNLAGSFIRLQEFIDGNRFFKVLGLFLLGLYIGRKGIYANLNKNKSLLKKVMSCGFIIGFPSTLLYAWSAMNGRPLGLTIHSVIYTFSVVPFAFFYISTICLWYLTNTERKVFKVFAVPGRMALTNYLMQSVFGIIIFYGIGFQLGARTGLVYVELIAVAVFCVQIIYSYLWLHRFRFGPFEWGWRMLTYGKWFKLIK